MILLRFVNVRLGRVWEIDVLFSSFSSAFFTDRFRFVDLVVSVLVGGSAASLADSAAPVPFVSSSTPFTTFSSLFSTGAAG